MTSAVKPVKRETLTSVRDRGYRPIIIEVHATFVKVRLKGLHYFYTITHDQLFNMGARNEAEAKRRERAAAKKARKEEA